MHLSTKGRYAVMAMADIAAQDAGSVVTLSALSERQNISLAYLEQLFSKLRRGGLVESLRGPGGGYRLSRPAEDISIAEVMAAVDEPVKMTRCMSEEDIGCTGSNRCLTHDLWRALGDQIVGFLGSITLQDVVDNALAQQALRSARATALGLGDNEREQLGGGR